MIYNYLIIQLSNEYRYRYNFWYQWDFSDISLYLFENIGIGINLRLGTRYRSDFWVSVSGISMDLGYRYESSSGYRYQGISDTLAVICSSFQVSTFKFLFVQLIDLQPELQGYHPPRYLPDSYSPVLGIVTLHIINIYTSPRAPCPRVPSGTYFSLSIPLFHHTTKILVTQLYNVLNGLSKH